MNIYEREGYKNRKEYLQSLVANFGLPENVVFTAASMLGKNEDFDGLISMLEDAEMMGIF